MLFAVDNTTLFFKNNINNSFAGKTYAGRSFEPSGEIRTHPSEMRSFYCFHSFLCARGVVRAQVLLIIFIGDWLLAIGDRQWNIENDLNNILRGPTCPCDV